MSSNPFSYYGAVSGGETEPLQPQSHQDDHESVSLCGKPLALIAGIGAIVTLMLLSVSSHHTAPMSLMGSSLLPKEDRPLFYDDQPIDHFNDDNDETWSNRYYKSTEYFQGAGHPIFMVVGGEGALDHGMLYPFVTQVLAKKFGAAVLQIEHRFYGPYTPVANATSEQLLELLTPAQAMADMVQLTRHVRDTEFVDCSPDRDSPDYCPIITVGASYPGFLSAMFRIVHGDFVDISYASSAPLLMYAQVTSPNAYYDIVTSAANRVSPGCAQAVRTTIDDMVDRVDSADSLKDAAKSIGVCTDSIPKYITTKKMLSEAIIQIASYAFADYDSTNYPPGPDTDFYKACKLFQNDELNTKDTLSLFFQRMLLQEEEEDEGCDMTTVECHNSVHDFDEKCFDLSSQLPDGPNSTIEDTGGDYEDGRMWDFQTCTCPIFLAGFSNTSLFPPEEATLKHLTKRCHNVFGPNVTPRPTELVDEWDYINKLQTTKYILFVNGMQDMWAAGSILQNQTDTVVAINLENGAHHSDLSHQGPSDRDTPDVKAGFVQIASLLEKWLQEIRVPRE